MKNKTLLILGLLMLSPLLMAAKVPLEAFAQKSQFKSVQISPDGKHIAYTFEEGNQVKLGVMHLESKKGIYAFDVGENREIVQFSWINNQRLYFVGGNITGWLDGAKKDYRAYFANLDGKKRKGVPLSYTRIVSFMEDDDDHVLILKNSVDGAKVHKMNVNSLKTNYLSNEPKAVGGMHSRIASIIVDHNDEPRFSVEYDPVNLKNYNDDVMFIHARDADSAWKNIPFDNKREKDLPEVNPLGFNDTNTVFYFSSNHDISGMGGTGLFSYDFNTAKMELLFRKPDVDLLGGVYDQNDNLIAVRFEAGYTDYHYLKNGNKEAIQLHKSLRASFPNADISITSYTKDKSVATLFVSSDKNPGDFYLYNTKKKSLSYLSSTMPQIDPKLMAAVEPFNMQARDGLKMYGQLTIPPQKELKNLPMVIYPHGGPYGPRDYWGWDARAQMLANNGYLVLQLNFRGSGGYGAGFQEAGYGEWGAKMQDDITDATLWAIKQGYADKDRICIHGVSYGGYAAMQAVVKEPDLYQCSIPDAGPYDLDYQLKKADSFKGQPKRRKWYFDRMLGENFEALNKERSPAYNLDKLKAPLLIVHGKEDKRVPIGNAYLLEDKLKEKGIKYETLYKKDGHGFQKVEYRVDLYKAMLKFLKKHIGN